MEMRKENTRDNKNWGRQLRKKKEMIWKNDQFEKRSQERERPCKQKVLMFLCTDLCE